MSVENGCLRHSVTTRVVMLPNPFHSILRNRHLIWAMTRRDVIGRYRGSSLGMLWSLVQPLLMLSVYTYVFGIVLEVRWGEQQYEASEMPFAVILFSGLILHGLLAEHLSRAPMIILQNTNFVKKVIFPLEIFPYIITLSSLFHAVVGLVILLVAQIAVGNPPAWTALLLPVVWMPFLILVTGISWFLSALGVYLRDVGQITSVLTTILLFLSPIMFPVDRLPEVARDYIYLNPLSVIVDQTRAIVLYGAFPDWKALGWYALVACIVAQLGFLWFQRARRGFADVL